MVMVPGGDAIRQQRTNARAGPAPPGVGRPAPAAAHAAAPVAPDRGPEPALLEELVEGEIIPRLLVAHRLAPSVAPPGPVFVEGLAGGPGPADVERLAADAIRRDAHALLGHVEAWLALGVPVETLLVELLAPAARCLGRWWEEDRCDFIDVTMGLWRLQEVMHEIAAGIPGAGGVAPNGLSALFGVPEGEAHVFGSIMVETCFRRAGWRTATELGGSEELLESRLADGWFDVAGLGLATSASLAAAPALVARLRRASRNPALVVLVGGPAIAVEPARALRLGADAAALDARRAVALASRLCARRTGSAGLAPAGPAALA